MRARWYDPYINRFASADTLVPDPENLQSFNRYSYVYNNPIKYFDLSGHDPLDSTWRDEFEQNHGRAPTDEDRLDRLFSIIFPGSGPNGAWLAEDWEFYNQNKHDLWNAVTDWPLASSE